jgi:hypothetical protein
MRMSTSIRAAVAATILIVPVALELAWSPFGDHALGLEIFALSQIVGWLLLLSVCREVAVPPRRSARAGRLSVLIGCALQMTFGLVYALTSFDGEPLEAAFAAFLFGFLALFVGGLMWGISLARTAAGRKAGRGLVATAVLGLMAMLFGMDPWHDVFLLSSYAAWIVVGLGAGRRPATDRARTLGESVHVNR